MTVSDRAGAARSPTPPRAVAVTGVALDTGAFLAGMMSLQGTGSLADWKIDGPAVQLTESNGSFQLRRPRNTHLLSRLRQKIIEDHTDVEAPDPFEPNSLDRAERLCIVLSHAPAAEQGGVVLEEIDALDEICRLLRQIDVAGQLDGILVVMRDALRQLHTPPAPVDAIDAWDRERSGIPLGAPPMRLAREPSAWRSPFERMDTAWSKRLTALHGIASAAGIAFATLPISLSGFNAATGEVRLGEQLRPRSIPFNVSLLARALNVADLRALPDCLTGRGLT